MCGHMGEGIYAMWHISLQLPRSRQTEAGPSSFYRRDNAIISQGEMTLVRGGKALRTKLDRGEYYAGVYRSMCNNKHGVSQILWGWGLTPSEWPEPRLRSGWKRSVYLIYC